MNLKFKVHQDSLTDLLPIRCPTNIFDTASVTLKDRTLNLAKMNIYVLQCQYWQQDVQTFLYSKYSSDSFSVFLNFYSKRLISFSVYFNSDSLSNAVDQCLVKYFGRCGRKLSDKQTNVYFHKNKDPLFPVIVSDAQAMKLMPSWCGNTTRRERRTKSWKKLGKYLSQK